MKAILLLLCFQTLTFAQTPPDSEKSVPVAAPPETPGKVKTTPVDAGAGDPFLRSGAASQAAPPSGPLVNLYGLVEYIEVPRDLWLKYSPEKPGGADATALRAEVQSWIKAGKARPIEMTCVPTRNGQRMVVESIIERIYPTSYLQIIPTPVPGKFEKRNTGVTFEWEPIVSSDLRTLDSSMAPKIVHMVGSVSRSLIQNKIREAGEAGVPPFLTHQATISISSQVSQPVLLDAIEPLSESGTPRDDVRWLIFFRGAAVQPTKPAKEGNTDSAAKSAENGPTVLSFELERLEVSLDDLNAELSGKDLDAGITGLRTAALEWIRSGRGKVLDRRIGAGKSGQRHVWESSFELNFPIKYGIDPTVGPTSFETRNTGYTVEMEPVLAEDGTTIDLSIVAQEVRHKNEVMFPQSEVNGKMVPAIEQPIFYTMKISTNLVTTLGQPALLSIATPANDQGEPDPKWRVLTFVNLRM
jgi:hypothetical protein